MNRIKHEVLGFIFLVRNLAACRLFGLRPLDKAEIPGHIMTGANSSLIKDADHLHRKLRSGRGLNFWRRILLRLVGSRICILALDGQGRPAGMLLYYFREKEWMQGIIHAACIGIDPESRQRGLARNILEHSLKGLGGGSRLRGVSNQITTGNVSLELAEKAGFRECCREYTFKEDKQIIHLYCDLDQYRRQLKS